jgi:catechol 1,2-dioxygenase
MKMGTIHFTVSSRLHIPSVYPSGTSCDPITNATKVPDDGPAGQLLRMMDRHPFRPAHIHLVVRHKGYKHLTTQIFDKDCKYLADDSVFAVKDELSVTFAPREDDPEANLELEYNITLAASS